MSRERAGRQLLRAFGKLRTAGYRFDAARRAWSARLFAQALRRLHGDRASSETFEKGSVPVGGEMTPEA